MRQFILVLTVLLLTLSPLSASTKTLESAAREAARHFADTSVIRQNSQQMVIRVVNLHSKVKDSDAKAMEGALYMAFSQKFSNFKLVIEEEGLTGISINRSVFLKVTYEPRDGEIILNFKALKGMDGQQLAVHSLRFDAKRIRKRNLVAVLDLEALGWNKGKRKIYSDVFRSALIKIDAFDLASSAEVDKMDADAIQQSQECTRDECATIIGEQLGVDRVISTSYVKVEKGL